jgi:pyruvate kinase
MDTHLAQTQCLDQPTGLDDLLNQLLTLRETTRILADERLAKFSADFSTGNVNHSAVNLAQYLALRRQDLRDIQDRLAADIASPEYSVAFRIQSS